LLTRLIRANSITNGNLFLKNAKKSPSRLRRGDKLKGTGDLCCKSGNFPDYNDIGLSAQNKN
jgi:hypothetical protein